MASYDIPAFWYERLGKDWFVFAPNVFFEASATGEFIVQLWAYEFVFQLQLMGFKLTPLEWQYAFDLEGENSRCNSLTGYSEIMDLNFTIQTNVNECSVGAFGFIANQYLDFPDETGTGLDCTWRSYEPQSALVSIPLISLFDLDFDFISWGCNDYSELETSDDDADESKIAEEDFGFADLDESQGGIDWTFDPTQ